VTLKYYIIIINNNNNMMVDEERRSKVPHEDFADVGQDGMRKEGVGLERGPEERALLLLAPAEAYDDEGEFANSKCRESFKNAPGCSPLARRRDPAVRSSVTSACDCAGVSP
jgi:hypothetical protein